MSIDSTTDTSDASISPSLLLMIKTHDPDAWRRLVRIYGPLVYSWCERRGIRGDDAADVGQEVFHAVADSIAAFRRDRKGDTFLGWLRTITRYKIADFCRRRVDTPQAPGGSDFQFTISQVAEEPAWDEDESLDQQGTRSLVYHRALQIIQSEFETRTWQAFWATAVNDRLTKDVAADLQMSTMAVRKAKSRVLRRLRDEFGDELDL